MPYLTKQGHLDYVMRIFGYMKRCRKQQIIFDYWDSEMPHVHNVELNWGKIYSNAAKDIPPDMHKPKGKPATVSACFDYNHARDLYTCSSVSCIIIFLNNTPVKSYCKRQGMLERHTYVLELIVGRIGTEIVMEIRYILRIPDIPMN